MKRFHALFLLSFSALTASVIASVPVPPNFVAGFGDYKVVSSSTCNLYNKPIVSMRLNYTEHNGYYQKDNLRITFRNSSGNDQKTDIFLTPDDFNDYQTERCSSWPYCPATVVGVRSHRAAVSPSHIRAEILVKGRGASSDVTELSISGKKILIAKWFNGQLVLKCEAIK